MLHGLNRGSALYKDLSDTFAVEVTLKEGRRFRYQIGRYLKQLYAGASEERLRRLVDEAVADKYLECKWDREHPLVQSEEEIRKQLMPAFTDYLNWLNETAAKKR
ncbi:MAG TPA: hypothetical protein VGF55_18320 [Gemmataceae bacterium]|jgi:hypothetical protein